MFLVVLKKIYIYIMKLLYCRRLNSQYFAPPRLRVLRGVVPTPLAAAFVCLFYFIAYRIRQFLQDESLWSNLSLTSRRISYNLTTLTQSISLSLFRQAICWGRERNN